MKFVPHKYQEKAIFHLLKYPGAGLFLDMGLGKTVITLTALRNMIIGCVVKKVLIIAPLRVATETWPNEIRKWDHLKDIPFQVIRGTPSERKAQMFSPAPIHIINVEMLAKLRKEIGKDWHYDCVVYDESSLFKSPGSQRFKAVRYLGKRVERSIILTGTPAANGLLDLWSQVFLIDKGERLFPTFTDYKNNWFISDYSGYKWHPRSEEVECQIRENISDICLSMSAEDYLSMPDRIDNNIELHFSNVNAEKYKELQNDMYLQLKAGGVEAVNAASLTGKCLQFSNGAMYLSDEDGNPTKHWEEVHTTKLDALNEIIEEAAGQPVLVFYNFRHDIERIQKRFKHAVDVKTKGATDKWNKGQVELMLAHPASAGHGLNLQDGGNIIVWFGLTWSLEYYQQANARLHRQGQTKPVFIHHLIVKDSIDDQVLQALHEKRTVQDVLLEALKEAA